LLFRNSILEKAAHRLSDTTAFSFSHLGNRD
jgi:hypothetical protein